MMSAGRIVLLIFGVIVLLVAVGLLLGGGAIIGIERALADGEGFINTGTVRLEVTIQRSEVPSDEDFREFRVGEGSGRTEL